MATRKPKDAAPTTKQPGVGRKGKDKQPVRPLQEIASSHNTQTDETQKPAGKKEVLKSTTTTAPASASCSLSAVPPPLPMEAKEPSLPIASAIKGEALEQALTLPVDVKDSEDPFCCAEYVNDIHMHMMASEQKPCYAISEHSVLTQSFPFTSDHRSILIDWLIQVHLKFQLLQETLYIAVDILDRYLDTKKVAKDELQLTGVTSMFLASKYEEIYPPSIFDFTYICAETYDDQQVRNMERNILVSLSYDLNKPFTIQFLRRYSKITKASNREHNLAKYILELSLLDWTLSSVRPSLKAAAALLLAKTTLSQKEVDGTVLLDYTQLEFDDLRDVMFQLMCCLYRYHRHSLNTVRRKYENKKYLEIAKVEELKRKRLPGQSSLEAALLNSP